MALSLRPEHLKRYKDMALVLMKYGRADLVRSAGLDETIEGMQDVQVSPAKMEELAADVEKMGPTFIKLAQLLSTRADLLPQPYIDALTRLQDKVGPFPFTEVEQIVAGELGVRISKAFSRFDATPIAAASLGQVHRAALRDGREVVVKVQRPGIREEMSKDMDVLGDMAAFLDTHTEAGRKYEFTPFLEEFRKNLLRELDYRLEARNLVIFSNNLRDFDRIVVPQPVEDYTTSRVLTMDYISGRKITSLTPLGKIDLDGYQLAEHLFQAYLQQILIDGFFHADPHPGNLLVMDTGHLAFFDFGMVGRITPGLQSKMIDAFFHVVGRDTGGLAQDLINLDFLKPGVNPESVRPVVEGLFRHYINLKLGDVNFKELTYDLAEVMYEYPFRLPSNFTYIIRALMTLEGIGLVTDPGFSFFETARPYAKEFMLKREGKQFRRLLLDKITGRDEGRINWGKMWKLAKLAAKTYLEKDDPRRPANGRGRR